MEKELKLLKLVSRVLDKNDFSKNKIYFDSHKLEDGLLSLLILGKKVQYCAHFKNKLTISYSQLLLIDKEKSDFPILLITDYVNPEMAERLRKNSIDFIDTVGNIFINKPPVFIFIKGNRAETQKTKNVTIAFKNSGLRIIFGLLTNAEMVNLPYREIATMAGVALGTVGKVMGDLKQLGFVNHTDKDALSLRRKEELLQRWITSYAETLRPKQILGCYSASKEFWNDPQNPLNGIRYGGEVAAAKITNYLRPQRITVYLDKENQNDFLLENRLKKDENGAVEVLEKFWKHSFDDAKENLVHPILVYADLIASGKQRNIETAKILYDREIHRFIREN